MICGKLIEFITDKNNKINKKNQESMFNKDDGFNKWQLIRTTGHSPKPSSAHSIVVIKNKVYFYGGITMKNKISTTNNILFEFNLDLHVWRKIKEFEDNEITPRGCSTMYEGLYNDSLIVIGGSGVDVNNYLVNDSFEYDLKYKDLKILHKNKGYTGYYGQSGCKYNNSILIVGGTKGSEYTNAVFELNLLTNNWKELITTGEPPPKGYKHQSIITDNKLYVIGGGSFKPKTSLITIHALDLHTLVWEEINSQGEVPIGRVAHTCVYDKETNNIYMWGGFDSKSIRLDDLSSYNVKTKIWKKIINNTYEISPKGKSFHSSIFYNGAIYLFGGSDGNNSFNDIWKYEIRCTPPSLSTLCAKIVKRKYMDALHENNNQDLIEGVTRMNKYATKLF